MNIFPKLMQSSSRNLSKWFFCRFFFCEILVVLSEISSRQFFDISLEVYSRDLSGSSFRNILNISSRDYSQNCFFFEMSRRSSRDFTWIPCDTFPGISYKEFRRLSQVTFREKLIRNQCKNFGGNQNLGIISGRNSRKSSGNNPEKICREII